MHKSTLLLASLLLFSSFSFTQTEFGDTLFSFNAGSLTPTQDYTLLGVEFAEDHFWITGMNAPYYNHRLYKISADGSTLVSYTSIGSGYHGFFDMAYDGEFLYVVDRDSIVQIDLNTGLPTGERIYISFDYLLLQGLAYDPVTDHFWVIPQRNGQLQVICEIDRNGNILNSYPNKNSDYTAALAWDTLSPGGPFLWTFSSEANGYNSRGVMRQFSPVIGQFTGVEIEMKNRSEFVEDSPLGMAFTPDLDSNIVTAIALQMGAIGITDGLDWVVVYNADLRGQPIQGPEITVVPASIQIQLPFGDSLEVPVFIGNTGTANLEWSSYIENPDTSNSFAGELGDTLFNFNLFDLSLSDTARFAGIAYAQNHFWFSASIFPDQKFIVKVDTDGNLVTTYPQPSFFGDRWSAIATDGNYLFGTERRNITIWSIESTS
ncbi:MAG: lactonase family protein, partial [Ignavibacteria bacterium]|nr:lactonase family protein [Ignavibacteria bacterium]